MNSLHVNMKRFFTFLAALLLTFGAVSAQEIQFQYDFVRSQKEVFSDTKFENPMPQFTVTFTGTHFDKWGSTFYFVDFDLARTENTNKVIYGEIQRSLNFWQNTALKDFYVEVEYDGGLLQSGGIGISQAFLTGFAYSFHNEDFSNFFQLQVLYRTFFGNGHRFGKLEKNFQKVPLQFTAVYTFKDLFGAKGLLFSGFADFWWQENTFFNGDQTSVIFTAEPQLWYNIGQHFGLDNLHVGGELEISFNAYNMVKHFTAYPAAGVRWTF